VPITLRFPKIPFGLLIVVILRVLLPHKRSSEALILRLKAYAGINSSEKE
jgi:hypothetical protein